MDYDVTGITDDAGYVKLAVILRIGTVASNGQALTLGTSRLSDKGADGTGTGDVVGPSGAISGAIVGFDGATGKLIKALTSAQATAIINAVVGDSGSGGEKGFVPAPAAGDAAGGKFLSANGGWVTIAAGLPPGHIYNLTMSNNVGDAVNDIDIAAGSCRSIDDAANIVLSTALTKRLDANWAVGLTRECSTRGQRRHIFAIRRPDTGACDVLASTSQSAPTMPANYTQKRRIGAIFVGVVGSIGVANCIMPFLQKGAGSTGWTRSLKLPPVSRPTCRFSKPSLCHRY